MRELRGTRAPTLLNWDRSKSYLGDGHAETLEQQARQPLFNAYEMAVKDGAARVSRVSAVDEYTRRDHDRHDCNERQATVFLARREAH